MKHDFHFVLTRELKNKIKTFACDKNMKMSEAVINIFKLMKPEIEKHFIIDSDCKEGEYTCFGSEVDMHVYFDKFEYRYLKQIQSNLYCFSMALVLRWILKMFFDGVDKFGFDVFCKVVGRFNSIVFRKNNDSNSFLGKKRHMFSCIDNFDYICHIFDKKYNLKYTKFT